MHQSARDGYRSYLQAYASHSLKKIFDVNALDLVKVGKAFGFSVPPRVNVTVGGGKSTAAGKYGKKRSRDEEDEGSGGENDWTDEEDEGEAGGDQGRRDRRQGKSRRIETLGHKKVQKEMFKKGKERKAMSSGGSQWSR